MVVGGVKGGWGRCVVQGGRRVMVLVMADVVDYRLFASSRTLISRFTGGYLVGRPMDRPIYQTMTNRQGRLGIIAESCRSHYCILIC